MRALKQEVTIKIEKLGHTYKTFERGETFKDMFRDFFSRKHKEVSSLKDVSFKVHRGEVLGLLGSNGAGKTTLLKILAGLLKPASGKVTVLGCDPYIRHASHLQRIGFVFGQKSQLNWDLPAYDTFDLLKAIYAIPQKTFEERLQRFTTLLHFSHKLRTPVRKLSLGERMKAELICALLHMPEVLFLDEPTIGLDIVSQKVIRDFVRSIVNEFGVSVILTSHYMSDIEILADRICILQNGIVTYEGSSQELLKKYTNEVELTFTPRNNFDSAVLTQMGFSKNDQNQWGGHFSSLDVNSKTIALLHYVEIDGLKMSSKSLEEKIYEMFSTQNIGKSL